jgi:hypothetical protein
MGMSLEEMYKLALNPKIYPNDRLLKIMQGQDTSLPMAVAMSAKQMRDKQTTALKGAQAKAQGAQPSVRDRMVAQGAQQEMAGLDQLPASTMEGMGDVAMGAGGGLVSFASGGFNSEDDEDAEQDDHDELTAMAARYGDLGGLGAGIMAVANPKAVKYSSFSLKAPGGIKDNGISGILSGAAEKHSLPTDLLSRIAQSESSGKKDAKNPNSTAKGLFQFTDRTWKGMGGKEGEQFDPVKNADLGAAYLRQNAEGLKKSLGRDPTYGEVYGAHHFGLAGIKNILNKKQDTPIDRVVSRQVIASNPYLKGKTVGDTLAFLNSKAGTGVVSLAGGGIVNLASGGTPAIEALLNAEYGYPSQTDKLLDEEYGPKDKKAKGAKAPSKSMSKEAADFLQKQAAKKAPTPTAASAPASTIPNAPNMPGGVKGFLGRQFATLGIPGLIYEGGSSASEAARNTLAAPGMEANRKALAGNSMYDHMLGAMGGDTSLASAIIQENAPAIEKARQEGTLGTPAAKPAAKPAAPATVDTNANANTGASNNTPPVDTKTTEPTRVDPFASSQKRLDDYLSGLAQQRKQDQGLGMILSGLTTAGTAGPLSSAIKQGAQTGIGFVGDAQKGYNAAMVQGLGAQSALDRNRVYQEMYGNKMENAAGLKYDNMIAGLDKVAEDRIKNMTKFGNFDLNKPEQRQKAINQIKYEMINANPNLKKHYLESTGLDELGFKEMFNPGLISATPTSQTVRTLPKQ